MTFDLLDIVDVECLEANIVRDDDICNIDEYYLIIENTTCPKLESISSMASKKTAYFAFITTVSFWMQITLN